MTVAAMRTAGAFLPRSFVTLSLLLFIYVSRFAHDLIIVPIVLLAAAWGDVAISRMGLKIALGVLVAVAIQAMLLGGQVESPFQLFHLAYVLIVALSVEDLSFEPDCLERFCRLTTLWNVAWLVLALTTPLYSIAYWVDEGESTPRFQSTLLEPSWLGMLSALNFFVLLRARAPRLAYLNLLPFAASFSFSGLFALLALGSLDLKANGRHVAIAGGFIAVFLLGVFVVAPDLLVGLVLDRVANSSAQGDDESFILRFVAPVDLARFALSTQDIRSVIGLGIGNVEHYLLVEQAAMPNHWRANGVRSTNPDSIIAFVIGAFGAVGILVLVIIAGWVAARRPGRPEYRIAQGFIAVLAVFSGQFVSISFWVWIFLLRQEQRARESSTAGTAAAVPGG